jgi:Uma2 family endonuclease
MSGAAFGLPPLRDVHDFLDWVHRQDGRYEFVDGRVVAMAGGTRAHNDVQVRLIIALGRRLEGGPCRVNGPDLLVRTDPVSDRRGRFPDASVECEPPTHGRLSDRPVAVFEVLSPETELADRGVKMREYLALASLRHYVMLAQDAPLVEVYSRHGAGGWLRRELEGPDAALALDPPGVEIPLRELYGGG